jgi:hypothetical protein
MIREFHVRDTRVLLKVSQDLSIDFIGMHDNSRCRIVTDGLPAEIAIMDIIDAITQSYCLIFFALEITLLAPAAVAALSLANDCNARRRARAG